MHLVWVTSLVFFTELKRKLVENCKKSTNMKNPKNNHNDNDRHLCTLLRIYTTVRRCDIEREMKVAVWRSDGCRGKKEDEEQTRKHEVTQNETD